MVLEGAVGNGEGIGEKDLIYDDREDEHYVVVTIADQGITLRQRDTEYYVPHTIFEEWYDAGRIKRNNAAPIERPDWIEE